MVMHAFQTLHPLLNTSRSDAQYFEAVEALVWLLGPESDSCLELLGYDPQVARKRADLGLFVDYAMADYEKNRPMMKRMYIAMARYSLQERRKRVGEEKIAFGALRSFSEEAVDHSYCVLSKYQREAAEEIERETSGTSIERRITSVSRKPVERSGLPAVFLPGFRWQETG